jgi:hypothetical protein
MGEQSADAGWPAILRGDVQRQPFPFGVGLVDRGSGLDELVDDLQPLVVSGEHQGPDLALEGEPGQRPPRDVARCCGHLQAGDAGAGGHQDIQHLSHPEYRRVGQGAAEVLRLHRNAVAYRIDRIFSQLEAGRENPDDWLLLELACRARRLG